MLASHAELTSFDKIVEKSDGTIDAVVAVLCLNLVKSEENTNSDIGGIG